MNLKNKNKGVKMKYLIIVLFLSSFSYSALGKTRCGPGISCFTSSAPTSCQLWGGRKEVTTDGKAVCVFPEPRNYCPKYIEEPRIVKSNGKKYCVARIKCQGQAANRDGSPFIAFVTCRATDNNECPSPTICAQDKQKQVEATGHTAKILEFEDISR